MRIGLKVVCDCGNVDHMTLKRTTNKLENGHVYEDYSSITNSIFNQDLFTAEQHHEDTVEITCRRCGKTHDIST